MAKKIKGIKNDALEVLTDYKWPGNVRELQHAIEKAVILSDKNEIGADDFFFNPSTNVNAIFEGTIEEMERKMISKVLQKSSSNLSATAQQLGITRQTLYNKMKKYNL